MPTITKSIRLNAYCAKGGHPKEPNIGYVCDEHVHTPGYYTHCAWCGQPMHEESRNWIHKEHLARNNP